MIDHKELLPCGLPCGRSMDVRGVGLKTVVELQRGTRNAIFENWTPNVGRLPTMKDLDFPNADRKFVIKH